MTLCKKCSKEFEVIKGFRNYCSTACKDTNKFKANSDNKIDWNSVNNDKDRIIKQKETWRRKTLVKFLRGDRLHIGTIKKILIERVDYTCEYCKLSLWMDKIIPLEIHHVDGNSKNNIVDNLHIICPNCHSQTDNFRAKNINKKIK